MGLVDPVKIYAAESNMQAQMICRLLQAQGIEAFAGQDVSPAGAWIGGTIPGVFDAGVFVSRADADRAYELMREHERGQAERAGAGGAEIEATCEDCGKTSGFPAAQRGTVQSCPHCGAWMDVGDVEFPDGWQTEGEPEAGGDRLSE
jgi:hypothetical protein